VLVRDSPSRTVSSAVGRPWGGQLRELPEIEAARKNAGFKNVRIEYGAVVNGER
jgi:hypothetical protein